MSNNTSRNRTGDRLTNFVFTLNNYTEAEVAYFKEWLSGNCKWAIFGKEVGEQGTPHLQGAGCLNKRVAFSTVIRALPRAHVATMHGKPYQSRNYCTKENGEVWEHGTCPTDEQGKRQDLLEVAEAINNGMSERDVAISFPAAFIKHDRGITRYRSVITPPRDPSKPPLCEWYYGPTGSGKSKTAYEFGISTYGEFGVCMLNDPTLKWFDGYNGQECVIIDDFRAKHVPFNWLLRLTDRFPLDVPIKGGFVRWKPSVIIFTTPHSVKDTFTWRNQNRPEDVNQLLRRITREREFTVAAPVALLPRNTGRLSNCQRNDGESMELELQCKACCQVFMAKKETKYCNACK